MKTVDRPGLKITYSDLLNSPQWRSKRAHIIKRDNNRCVDCGTMERLRVHHKYYSKNKAPWEYPDDSLITVCDTCHEKIHTRQCYKKYMKAVDEMRTQSQGGV